jgi:hypothetical protein
MSTLAETLAAHVGADPNPEQAAFARAALHHDGRVATLDAAIRADAALPVPLRDPHAGRERWMAAQARAKMLGRLGLTAAAEPGAPVPPGGRQWW